MPTVAPSADSASARLTAVVDLPTPPLPEATAMMFLTPGISFTPRCTACDTTFERTRDARARRAGRLQRLDHLAADRLELALARIAELDVDATPGRPSTLMFLAERVATKSLPVFGSTSFARTAWTSASLRGMREV